MAGCEITPQSTANAFDFLTLEIILILLVSNILHFFLKRLGQPSIISQFIAGILVGRTVLLRSTKFSQRSGGITDYFDDVVLTTRFIFMFIIGLEVDIIYLRRNIRHSFSIAFASITICFVLTLVASPLLYHYLAIEGANVPLFIVTLALILSNTASPVLVCIVTELKLVSSKIGKLAISSAVVTDLTAVVAYMLLAIEFVNSDGLNKDHQGRLINLIVWVIIVTLTMLFMKWLVKFINVRNRKKRYISNVEVWILLLVVGSISIGMEFLGYNGKAVSFLVGLAFPRRGPSARTVLDKLMFPVHYIILPLFFSAVFVKYDLSELSDKGAFRMVGLAFFISFISMVGKIAGTVVVTRFLLKMRLKEGVMLGILLNVKGYMDLVFISIGGHFELWGIESAMVMLLAVVINTFIACPIARYIVTWERREYRYSPQSLEHIGADGQIRILACVHKQQEVPATLALSNLCAINGFSLVSIYLLHLVELTNKYAVALYNQKSLHAFSWDNDSDDMKQVSVAADAFSNDTGLLVQQLTAMSSYRTMHEDVYLRAEEVRACLVLLPFHKEQRYDRKMVCRRDEKRQLNLKVLQHAPCTIGILVDRPMGAGMSIGMPNTSASVRSTGRTSTATVDPETPATTTSVELVHQVVAIFFGGPDDREAASFLARIASNRSVNATLVRFLPQFEEPQSKNWSSRCMSEFALITERDMQFEIDEQFMTAYQQRHVETGNVTYIEQNVSNGPETVTALAAMAGMYSLFIVGKGGQNLSTMMMGIRDWEECPELGPIGDLLASDDFMDSGSVLIMQQHKVSRTKSRVDEDVVR